MGCLLSTSVVVPIKILPPPHKFKWELKNVCWLYNQMPEAGIPYCVNHSTYFVAEQ